MKRWPLIVAVTMLLGTWGLLQSMSHGEPIPNKKPFADFPLLLAGHWEGKELGIEEKILKVLRVSDYMMRKYQPLPGEGRGQSPVFLYVGYYQSQRTGAAYHSPKNCLPGAGWQFVESADVPISVGGGPPIVINRAIIQKGLEKQIVLYWYHDRGRVIASEYWAKGYMVWDAMTKNRTDGSLVRISMTVVTTVEDAEREATAFLRDMWPVLNDYMPAGVQHA